MAIDSNLVLFSNTDFNVTDNSTEVTNGTDLNIGKAGLHRNAQMVTIVQTANADRALTFDLYLSLNGSTFRQIGALEYPVNFAGKQVLNIGTEIPWQEYVESEIELRLSLTAVNHANVSDFNRVKAFIGYGESQAYGRKADANTLVDA